MAVLITDGQSNVDRDDTVPGAVRLRSQTPAVEVYVIAAGQHPDMDQIDGIASQPIDSHVISGLVTSTDVEIVVKTLLDLICQS